MTARASRARGGGVQAGEGSAASAAAAQGRMGFTRGMAALALLLQGCGLFGGGTPPCENPQMYQNAQAADPLSAPEGLETLQSFGNLEVPEGEVLEGQPRRSDGSCLEEPPRIERPGG